MASQGDIDIVGRNAAGIEAACRMMSRMLALGNPLKLIRQVSKVSWTDFGSGGASVTVEFFHLSSSLGRPHVRVRLSSVYYPDLPHWRWEPSVAEGEHDSGYEKYMIARARFNSQFKFTKFERKYIHASWAAKWEDKW